VYDRVVARETAIGGDGGQDFPRTRWSRIVATRGKAPEERRTVLEEVLLASWRPLYFFARRKGLDVERAKDATQSFCAHLLERDFLERLDPGKGKLRGYLKTALEHWLANQHEAERAQKRGGGKVISLDAEKAEAELGTFPEDPGAAFDREWVLAILARALAKLEQEFADGTRKGPFDVVRRYFALDGQPPSYEDGAKACATTVPAFKASIHRARTRYRELVRAEVRETVQDPPETDAEVDELLRQLA
jgi:RNA polymerase sigma-70 factor (ECF subfamily)